MEHPERKLSSHHTQFVERKNRTRTISTMSKHSPTTKKGSSSKHFACQTLGAELPVVYAKVTKNDVAVAASLLKDLLLIGTSLCTLIPGVMGKNLDKYTPGVEDATDSSKL